MIRAWGAAVAALALLAAPAAAVAAGGTGAKTVQKGGAKAEPKAGAKADAKSGAKPAADDAGFVYTVNGSPISVADLWSFLQTRMTMMHAYRIGRGAETFNELTGKRIDQELLLQEAIRRGLDPAIERGVFRFRRTMITAADYLRTVVLPSIVVPPEQIEAQLPHDFRTFKIRQVLLESEEEAEEVRRRLARGEDFVALVREKSIGMEIRKDGMLWDYKANGGIFTPEQERYLFALPLNEVSKPLSIGIGFAVARIETKVEPLPGVPDRARIRARKALTTEMLQKRGAEILAAGGERNALGPDELLPLVTDWLEKGRISDREVGRAGGGAVLFSELAIWQKERQDPQPNLNVEQMLLKLESVLKGMLDDAVIAAEARRRGHQLSKEAQVGVDFHKRAAMLAELHRRAVESAVTIKNEELKPYWEAHRDDFKVTEAVELRHILVQDAEEAGNLIVELRGGADFAALAKEHSTDPSTKDKGGNLGFVERGKTYQAFEDAAFGLREPGEIVKEAVRTPYGLHVIQLVSRRPAQEFSFEESRERVRGLLRGQREQAVETEIVGRLRAEGKIVADEKNLTRVREAFVKKLETKPKQAPKGHH